MSSPEYQGIVNHRLEASVGNVIMVKGLEQGELETMLAK
jgi:uncharacterized protein (DUF1330 family)